MDNSSEEPSYKVSGSGRIKDERTVYVMPPESGYDDGIDLVDLWNTIWEGKWVVFVVTALISLLSLVYVLNAAEWYRAEVLLAPDDEKSNQELTRFGGLSSLAGLAGINVDGDRNAEHIAVLKSRDFTRAFIEDKNLLQILLADQWDVEAGRWKSVDASEWPDVRDAIRYFDENVRTVSENPESGLVTLSIEWTEPEVAADWANALVARLNNHMRERALAEAAANIEYLQKQLATTSVAPLQESIGSLLEIELQKFMLARGKEEFAYRVIDSAQVPKESARPNRKLFVFVAMIFGGMISIVSVLIRNAVRQSHPTNASGD